MSREPIDLEQLDNLNPDQTPQETKLVSRLAATTTIWKRGVPMFLSYSYCYQLLFFQILGKYLPGKTEDNIAATALYIPYLDFCVMVSASTSFSLNIVSRPLRSKIESAARSPDHSQLLTTHQNNMSRSIKNGFIQAAPFTLLSTGALLASKYILTNWFRQDETVSGLAAEFLLPMGPTMFLYLLRALIEALTLSYNQETRVMGISVVSLAVFGIACSYLLSIQFGMGMEGLAWATIIENIVTFLFCAGNLRFSQVFKDFHFLKSFFSFTAADRTQLKELFPNAMFFLLTLSSEWFMAFVTNSLAGMVGKNELGARNLVSPVILIGTMISMAFGQATLLEVSGAGNHAQQAIRFARYGIVASTIAVAMLNIFVIFPSLLTSFADGVNDETIALATQIMPWTVGSMLIYNLALNMLMSLRAKGLMLPNFLYLGGLASGIPISWALGLGAKRGLQGIAEGALAGPAIAAAAVAIPFFREFKLQSATTPQYVSLTERSAADDSELSINRPPFELMLDQPEPPTRFSSSRYGCFSRFLQRVGWSKPEPIRASSFEF